MASSAVQHDSDDDMDAFMDKFKSQRYKSAFSENNWEEVRNILIAVVQKVFFCRSRELFASIFNSKKLTGNFVGAHPK